MRIAVTEPPKAVGHALPPRPLQHTKDAIPPRPRTPPQSNEAVKSKRRSRDSDLDNKAHRSRTVRSLSPAPSPKSYVPVSRTLSPAPPRRRSSMNRRMMALMNRYESGDLGDFDDDNDKNEGGKDQEKANAIEDNKAVKRRLRKDRIAGTEDDSPTSKSAEKTAPWMKEKCRRKEGDTSKPKPTSKHDNRNSPQVRKNKVESSWIKKGAEDSKDQSVLKPSRTDDGISPKRMRKLKKVTREASVVRSKKASLKNTKDGLMGEELPGQKIKRSPKKKTEKESPWKTQLRAVSSDPQKLSTSSISAKEKTTPWTGKLRQTKSDVSDDSGNQKEESAPWMKEYSSKVVKRKTKKNTTTKVSFDSKKEKPTPFWEKGNDKEKEILDAAKRAFRLRKKNQALQRHQEALEKEKRLSENNEKLVKDSLGKSLPSPNTNEQSPSLTQKKGADMGNSASEEVSTKQIQEAQLPNSPSEGSTTDKQPKEAATAVTVTPDSIAEGQKASHDADRPPIIQPQNDTPAQETAVESRKANSDEIEQQSEADLAESKNPAMSSQDFQYERSESDLGFGESYEVSYRDEDFEDDSDEDDDGDNEDFLSSSEEGAVGPAGFGRSRSWQDSMVSTASFTLSLGSCDEVSTLEADFGDDEEIEEEDYSIDDISVSEDERYAADFQKSMAEIQLRTMFSKASLSFDPDTSEIEEITEAEEDGDFPTDTQPSPAKSGLSDAKAYLVAMAEIVSPSGKKGSPVRHSRRMSEVSAVSEYSEYEIEESEEFEEDVEEEYIDDIEEEFVVEEEEVTEVEYAEEDDLDGNPVQVSAS